MAVTHDTANRDSAADRRDSDAVTVSRAPAEPTAVVTLSRCVTLATVTRDSDKRSVTLRVKEHEGVDLFAGMAQGCDSDSAPLRCAAVTVTPATQRREEQKAKLAADPRFAGWVAGQA